MKKNIINFLKKEMCIDTNHLMDKLNSIKIIKYKESILSQIDCYIQIITHDYKNCKKINKIYKKLENEDINKILDSIRHAMLAFCEGGICNLWVHQENQGWYPKIVITETIEPNDIDSLPNEVTIFRGCDISEKNSHKFGQAWSISPDCAQKFAYHHYINEDWFKHDKRIVVQAKIKKENIYYFSDQSDQYEKEVIVDQSKLFDIKIYETYGEHMNEK
ncbi:MAG: hypothetical protein LGB67_05325 [Sulfurovum sp.]|nr:hypothetical protein [Sulfurovum sp.]MCB4775636.1 hypothetical protein [Sulfurovum sp.]